MARHRLGSVREAAVGLENYIQEWKRIDGKGPQGWHRDILNFILRDITEARLLETVSRDSAEATAEQRITSYFVIAMMQDRATPVQQQVTKWQQCIGIDPTHPLAIMARANLRHLTLGFTPGRLSERREELYELDKDFVRVVTNLQSDRPGAKSGIQNGDILLSIDGKDLNQHHLDEALQTVAADRPMAIEVLRRGEKKKVSLTYE